MAISSISSNAVAQPAVKAVLPILVSSNSAGVLTGFKSSPSSLPPVAGSPGGVAQGVGEPSARPVRNSLAQQVGIEKSSALNAEDMKKLSQEMQRKIADLSPELQFSVDDDSGRPVIKVTDRTTNELVRQIPSEEALQIARDVEQFQKGLLLNRKV